MCSNAVVLLFVVLAGINAATASAWMYDGPRRSLQQAPQPDWVVILNRGVSLNDVACSSAGSAGQPAVAKESGRSSKAACQVCGGAPAIAAACMQHSKCVAFVMDTKTPTCGYLKSAVSNQANTPTQTLYCSTARGAKCKGEYTFTPRTGMMFTGDYQCNARVNGGGQTALCFVPGNINAVAAACTKDPACKAFAYNRADQGGYLKNAGGVASPTSGSDLYQRT